MTEIQKTWIRIKAETHAYLQDYNGTNGQAVDALLRDYQASLARETALAQQVDTLTHQLRQLSHQNEHLVVQTDLLNTVVAFMNLGELKAHDEEPTDVYLAAKALEEKRRTKLRGR
ncbi:hypothetical protein EP56_01800 [Listeriaceae bacterium FSL A5-0209]|nr:hypothetical protein EP56_01800 [Listeriaceae bacterium FSL A5-0209]